MILAFTDGPSITLPNPEWQNSIQPKIKHYMTTSMSGNFFVYTARGSFSTIVEFTVINVTRAVLEALRVAMKATNEITFTDWHGDVFTGNILTNPLSYVLVNAGDLDASCIEDERGTVTLQLEIS